jgi:hypothetical protein
MSKSTIITIPAPRTNKIKNKSNTIALI